jgi:hypothetical protein
LFGNEHYPVVEATEEGGGLPYAELILNLDDGSLKVRREDTTRDAGCFVPDLPCGVIPVISAQAACASTELSEGRGLFTQALIDTYKASGADASTSVRRMLLGIVWPHAAETDYFEVPAASGDPTLRRATDFMHAMLEKYQPPLP